jgi:MFS family permease
MPAQGKRAQAKPAHLLEPWFAPFALVNGSAVGLVPILLPLVAIRYGVGHVGLVMGAFNVGALAAPLTGNLADRYHSYRLLTAGCAAASAVSLWLFPLAGPWLQVLLALVNGAGFAGAVTVANLLIVERQKQAEWNQRLGWLETALSIGQGAGLLLAAWLAGLHARPALLIAALVPASGVPLALLLIPTVAARPRVFVPHRLTSIGRVGEWGPASPSRTHHLVRRRARTGLTAVLRGGFGWFLAAWMTAYAATAIVFALYPVLFRSAFAVPPRTSALAFAAIVFASLPLFVVAGRLSQRRGPAAALTRALAARVILLTVLAVLAAIRHVSPALPLLAFAGIMFAWSFLSVASPGLTAQLVPGDEGDAQGALNASSGLAGLVGSVAGGFAAAHWGYPAALGIGAGAVAVGLAIFLIKVMHQAPQGQERTSG